MSSIRISAFIAAIVLVVATVLWAAWNWDPFHRRQRAERRADQSSDIAAAAVLAADGARAAAKAADLAGQRRDAAAAATARLQVGLIRSEISNAPLPPERARRLREHDRELCAIAPELSGCSAPN